MSDPAHDPLGGTAAARDVHDALRRRAGKGTALPDALARAAGERLGADLSGVRVHADNEADRLARSVQSKAFTFGTDIYFTKGTYAPHAASGQRVLAHELAHAAQHRSGRFRAAHTAGAPMIGKADDPAEADADRGARAVVPALQRQAVRVAGTGSR